jgi:hypothetical protein
MLQRIWHLGFCLALFASLLSAQTGVGQIQGTVSDPTSAVVPQASVTLENVQTDTRLQTVTNEVGAYMYPA